MRSDNLHHTTNEPTTMNTASKNTAADNLNVVATVSTVLAALYFVAANFIF